MRKPSRSMPPLLPRPWGWAKALVLSIFVIGFIALLVCHPWVLIPISGVIVLIVVEADRQNRHLSRLAIERDGESICTFARSFDYRVVDTWIIRAVFEERRPWCQSGRLVMPLRASDDIEAILKIDLEDLDELFSDIAHRSCRSTENCDRNPLFGKVKTVSDLVSFLMNQPSTKSLDPQIRPRNR